MFSFGRDKQRVVTNVSPTDIICFCFGEIDCRCHINKYEPSWKESVDYVVESYFDAIKLNVNNHDPSLVYVYNVVPPIEREAPKNLWMKGKSALPALGTDEDRKKYTRYMNDKLKEMCSKKGYIYLDVYNKYIDDNGFLIGELSDNNCHIKNPIYISEFLENKLNENEKN
jgi:hypothetical protein